MTDDHATEVAEIANRIYSQHVREATFVVVMCLIGALLLSAHTVLLYVYADTFTESLEGVGLAWLHEPLLYLTAFGVLFLLFTAAFIYKLRHPPKSVVVDEAARIAEERHE